MSNELTKVSFKSLSGIDVTITAETVVQQLTRGNGKITPQEVAFFLRTCEAKRLDPFETGEVYLVKYDDKAPAQLVIGYHAYLRRAEKFPEYRGYKAGVVVMRKGSDEPMYKEGSAVYKSIGETLLGGWCRVFREMPNGVIDETYAELSFDEYTTGKANWVSKPGTMIRKCAIAQAIRGAFPNEYEGLYTQEELESNINADDMVTEVEEPIVSKEQRQELFKLAMNEFGREEGQNIIKAAIEVEGCETTEGMSLATFEKVTAHVMEAIQAKHESEKEE